MAKLASNFPAASLKKMVHAILPRGQSFQLRVSDSGFDQSKVVRVITPAWKKLQRHERISKLLEVEPHFLTAEQKKHVLRYSVLTPQEYDQVVTDSPLKIKSKALK